jgi:hypothetical protein
MPQRRFTAASENKPRKTIFDGLESGPLRSIAQNPASRLASSVETLASAGAFPGGVSGLSAVSQEALLVLNYRFHEYRASGYQGQVIWSRTCYCETQPCAGLCMFAEHRVPRAGRVESKQGAREHYETLSCSAYSSKDPCRNDECCIASATAKTKRTTTRIPHSNSSASGAEIRNIFIHSVDRRLFMPVYQMQPTIRVRPRMIFAALHRHLCAVLEPERLLIQDFDCEHARILHRMVSGRLTGPTTDPGEAFGFRALAAMLHTCVQSNERKLQWIKQQLQHGQLHINTVEKSAAPRLLQGAARQVALVALRARNLRVCLEESLDDGIAETVAAWVGECIPGDDAGMRASFASTQESVHTLIEWALWQCHDHEMSAAALRKQLHNIEELTVIALAAKQTRLWTVNISCHLWFCTLLIMLIPADFFGMNIAIPAYEETAPSWPWFVVVAVSLVLGAGFLMMGILYWKRKGMMSILFAKSSPPPPPPQQQQQQPRCSLCERGDETVTSGSTSAAIDAAECC